MGEKVTGYRGNNLNRGQTDVSGNGSAIRNRSSITNNPITDNFTPMGIISDPDEYFMKEALKLAEKALQEDEVPIGAVIISDNGIVAKAYNLVEKLHDPTAHAEMQAITAACNYFGAKYLPDCTLYVTLEPCPMCAAAAYWSQVSRVVFGASDPKMGFSRYKGIIHPKTEIKTGVLAENSSALLLKFFKGKR